VAEDIQEQNLGVTKVVVTFTRWAATIYC